MAPHKGYRVSEKRPYDESSELDSSGPTASDTHIHVYGKIFLREHCKVDAGIMSQRVLWVHIQL